MPQTRPAPNHVIFLDWYTSLRAGGPSGYIATLEHGLGQMNLPSRPQLSVNAQAHGPQHTVLEEGGVWRQEDMRAAIDYYSNPESFLLKDDQERSLFLPDTRSIHTHLSVDLVKVLNRCAKLGRNDILLMHSSHCPESLGLELSDIWRERGFDSALADQLEAAARRTEAIAFKGADVWVFPSREAMEPYEATIPAFGTWAREKDIRFVATGACAVSCPSTNREELRRKLGIRTAKAVGFVGRHNRVKGYDVFCDACVSMLREREDLTIVVAGRAEPLSPPAHERWIEFGWHPAPGEVFAAVDVLALPNRRTYFDLVLLEALSSGVPVVASATGGNKSVHAMTGGAIVLFEGGADELKHRLSQVLDCAEVARALGRDGRAAYERFFSPVAFAAAYADLIDRIYSDYKLLEPSPTLSRPLNAELEAYRVRVLRQGALDADRLQQAVTKLQQAIEKKDALLDQARADRDEAWRISNSKEQLLQRAWLDRDQAWKMVEEKETALQQAQKDRDLAWQLVAQMRESQRGA